MRVYIIGKTIPFLFQWDNGMNMPGKAKGSAFEQRSPLREYEDNPQELIEFAGRLCYESFDLPNEKTKENSGYIRNIISLGHESVLEHVSVTFYVEGVSRNLSHELIRHRHLSFSELSQRYVDMSEANYVEAPALGGGVRPLNKAKNLYEMHFKYLFEDLGFSRKKAREAARYTLPAGTETKFVVTGNLRAWRDVLKKRDSVHADAEMQLFAKEVKRLLLNEYPDVFADLDGENNEG